jgi:uncharacterized cupin superfamily protein
MRRGPEAEGTGASLPLRRERRAPRESGRASLRRGSALLVQTRAMSWFVRNVRELPWFDSPHFALAGTLETEENPYPQVGYTIGVLSPGRPSGLYHSETNDEEFLVLSGECLLLVNGEERRLKQWDFFHCPAGTDHILVGAGDGPCVVFMVGARLEPYGTVYPESELARRHNAEGAPGNTSPAEAYAPYERWKPVPPPGEHGLPFER